MFFPSNTLIYGISRDDSKIFNIRTCEHMILGQLRIWARQAKNAALMDSAAWSGIENSIKILLIAIAMAAC